MEPDVLVCRRSRSPLRVSAQFRRTAAYRQFAAQMAQAATYSDATTLLESLARSPHALDRAGAALDFAPHTTFARQFLNTTALALSQPVGDPMRGLAERALKALSGLQRGPLGTPGRPRQASVPAATVAALMATRRTWEALLRPMWRDTADDPSARHRAVWSAARGRMPTAEAYRVALDRLMTRRGLRPADVATQLTAWQAGVSVRCVRLIVHAARVPRSADRQFA